MLGGVLVFRVHRHALHHQHLGLLGCGPAQNGDLLLDVGLAPAMDRLFPALHVNGHGVGAGGFAEHPQPACPQPGLDQAADGGFAPGAVHVHHMGKARPGLGGAPGLPGQISQPPQRQQGDEQGDGFHGCLLFSKCD